MKKKLSFFYDIRLDFDRPVSRHAFLLRCIPPSFPGQRITDVSLCLYPQTSFSLQKDGFSNLLEAGFLEDPHDVFRYTVRGTAVTDCSERRPGTVLPVFRYPSPYTVPGPSITSWIKKLDLPSDPVQKAEMLCHAVHQCIRYSPGVTGVTTSASEAFDRGAGVCQDYAHIFLTAARLSGLTARYANGLTEGEGLSHAWCEVLLNGIWTGIDPTRNRYTDESYIRFCTGRDFGDCPIERGVFFGLTLQHQHVYTHVVTTEP